MDKLAFFDTDCASIMSQIKHQEKQLRLKRRWLLGLSTSKSDEDPLERPEFLNDGLLPESMLREDDIFYETLKLNVKEAFRLHDAEQGCEVVQDHEQLFSTSTIRRALDIKLDALTNKGLYLVAMIITEGSAEFKQTRKQMKEIIRHLLAKGLGRAKCDYKKNEILRQLHQVLNDPRNFRKDGSTNLFPTVQSHREAAAKVLDELEKLPFQTLIAMKRKLKCVSSVPQLNSRRSGQSRSHLIKQVRAACERMLSELHEQEELQEPLAKAMALADLSLKLSLGYRNFSTGDFYQFTPEIIDLQDKIVKAIWLLKKKEVRFPELKSLQLLLDPEADIPNGCLRTAVKKLLTEYLFECSDVDTIPKSLLQALAVVNRHSRSVEHKVFPKEAVEEEVECVLIVAAQMKQIVRHWLPDYQFDLDFTDAYMEELEDSEDDDFGSDDDDFGQGGDGLKMEPKNTQDSTSHSFDSDHEESIAECTPFESTSACATSENSSFFANNGSVNRGLTEVHSSPLHATPLLKESRILNCRNNIAKNKFEVKIERDEDEESIGLDQSISRSCFSIEETKFDSKEQKKSRIENQYLSVQEVCDETSMVAYNLVGHLLEKFAEEKGVDLDRNDRLYLGGKSAFQEDNHKTQSSSEGSLKGSTIVEVVKVLMPCLQNGALMTLKKVMDVG